MLSNSIKTDLNTKTADQYCIARGDHKKIIKVTKVLHVNCAPVAIAKGLATAYSTDVC